MKLVFCGQFHDASGYGNAARNYLAAFDKNNIRNNIDFYIASMSFESNNGSFLTKNEKQLIDKYSLSQQQIESLIKEKDYYAISFHTPDVPRIGMEGDSLSLYNKDYHKLMINAKKIVNMVVWETNRVPNSWLTSIFDNVIVPCKWNENTFKTDTKSKIHLLPYPQVPQTLSKKKESDKFNILSISQWTHRKGFDLLIKAYCAEFFDNTDTCLTIKTYRNEVFNPNKEQEKNIILNEAKNYKNSISNYENLSCAKIKIIADVIDKDNINFLYDEADVFCLATRGEGFGLTISEAASKGLPCIVPNIGGHVDYLDVNNNFLYDSQLSTVIGCYSKHYSSLNMKYVESNFEDLRLKMRTAYEIWKKDKNKLSQMGQQSKNYVDKYLDDVIVTNKFIEIMKGIENE